jgi:hypothetical protein
LERDGRLGELLELVRLEELFDVVRPDELLVELLTLRRLG